LLAVKGKQYVAVSRGVNTIIRAKPPKVNAAVYVFALP